MKPFTVAVLCYGDHSDLAARCLGSLASTFPEGARYVREVRIGLNAVSAATRQFVDAWAVDVWRRYSVATVVYDAPVNAGKNPLMRRMVHEPPHSPAPFLMWFDDDTYVLPRLGWWSRVHNRISGYGMIGQTKWLMPMQGNQWKWIERQPWFNSAVGLPPMRQGRRCFRFCQGAWWVIRTQILQKYDWPSLDFRHKGEDSLLGELFRHQGLCMAEFTEALHVNADELGRQSRAPRRGINEPDLGVVFDPDSPTPDHSHHDFEVRRTTIPAGWPDATGR